MLRRSLYIAGFVTIAFLASPACSGGERPPSAGDTTRSDSAPTGDAGRTGTSTEDSRCRNTTKDGAETDIDCGGPSCAKCALGKACKVDGDCADVGAKCTNSLCSLCDDGKTNGDETDVDCGGKACGPCSIGKACKTPSDCKGFACVENSCGCPRNMTIVARSGGGAYCIDSAEVTKGQYNKFITANVPVDSQEAVCAPPVNTTFVPRGAWPPATSPGTLDFNLSLPVHYVDWCDAYAYCRWAKKELCGAINGGPISPADRNNHEKDAWFNACTAQGTKALPYGDTYLSDKCNGAGAGAAPPGVNYGYAANDDDNVYIVAKTDSAGAVSDYVNTACQGGSVGLYQMSGNVAEWVNSCDGTASSAQCYVRGGSYAAASNVNDLQCTASRVVDRTAPENVTAPYKDIGFRCCVY